MYRVHQKISHKATRLYKFVLKRDIILTCGIVPVVHIVVTVRGGLVHLGVVGLVVVVVVQVHGVRVALGIVVIR